MPTAAYDPQMRWDQLMPFRRRHDKKAEAEDCDRKQQKKKEKGIKGLARLLPRKRSGHHAIHDHAIVSSSDGSSEDEGLPVSASSLEEPSLASAFCPHCNSTVVPIFSADPQPLAQPPPPIKVRRTLAKAFYNSREADNDDYWTSSDYYVDRFYEDKDNNCRPRKSVASPNNSSAVSCSLDSRSGHLGGDVTSLTMSSTSACTASTSSLRLTDLAGSDQGDADASAEDSDDGRDEENGGSVSARLDRIEHSLAGRIRQLQGGGACGDGSDVLMAPATAGGTEPPQDAERRYRREMMLRALAAVRQQLDEQMARLEASYGQLLDHGMQRQRELVRRQRRVELPGGVDFSSGGRGD